MMGVFQKDLEKSVLKSILFLVGISSILFLIGMYVTTIISNHINASKHLKLLEKSYIDVYRHSSNYLYNNKTQELCQNIILGDEVSSKLIYYFNTFNAENKIKSKILITTSDGETCFSTFSIEEMNSHLVSFNKIVCENAKSRNENSIYQAVYFMSEDTSSYVLCCPLYKTEELIGFVNLYLDNSGWNTLFSDYQFDGIITDGMGHIIYSSRQNLGTQVNKFQVKPGTRHYYSNNERYWLATKVIEAYEIRIHSLVYYPQNASFAILGVVTIIILGICWFNLAKQMSREMAERKSASIKALVNEIKVIRRGEHEHRIELDTKDEISDVGHEINRMLDNIKKLNEKNTELIHLNNTIEIKQLTEQINPHFLYNTLETIRYLVLMDPKRAEDLIVQFTKILRYSINNTKKDVVLQEDMEYIQDYLDIQSSRFENRFKYKIEIDAVCNSCIIPKLLLQPIIENSIKYGFKKKMEIEVGIYGFMDHDILCLEVRDNGAGMEEKEMEELQYSVEEVETVTEHNGLRNIARRLYLQYGTDSGIKFRRNNENGLTVTLCVSQKRGGSYVQGFTS